MPYYIYELVDPRTDTIGYVGHTKNPKVRLSQHTLLHDVNEEKNTWVREMLHAGVKPEMRILEEVESRPEAIAREKHWILTYFSNGIQLKNHQGIPQIKSQEGRAKAEFIFRSMQWSEFKQKDYGDYPLEQLAHPEYLDDLFASQVSESEKEDGHKFTKEEIALELELFMISSPFIDHSKEGTRYIKEWYAKHFEKGGIFEGEQPTIPVNI